MALGLFVTALTVRCFGPGVLSGEDEVACFGPVVGSYEALGSTVSGVLWSLSCRFFFPFVSVHPKVLSSGQHS